MSNSLNLHIYRIQQKVFRVFIVWVYYLYYVKFSISFFQILSFAFFFSFISPTYCYSSTSDSLSHISVLLSSHLPFNFKLTLFCVHSVAY